MIVLVWNQVARQVAIMAWARRLGASGRLLPDGSVEFAFPLGRVRVPPFERTPRPMVGSKVLL